MKRPLVKLYIIITIALIATVLVLPTITRKTSSFAVAAITQADVALYNIKQEKTVVVDDMAKAVIVMDDGWETQYTRGLDILSRYDMDACIAVVPELVGQQGYMSYRQLAKAYTQGWDLLNHTYNHYDLATLGEEDQFLQISSGQDWLDEHGFVHGNDIVVYPYGSFNEDTIKALKQNSTMAARSFNSVWDSDFGYTREDIEVINLISDITLEKICAAIDKAISSNSYVILMLHKIEPVTDDTQMQIDEKLFLETVEYLDENKDEISVVTFSQLLDIIS